MNIPFFLALIIGLSGTLGLSFIHIIFRNKPSLLKVITIILLVLYLICLTILTLVTNVSFSKNGVDITLIQSAPWFSKKILWTFSHLSLIDFLINIVMMYPLGYLIAILSKHNLACKIILKTFAFSFLVSLCIESLQWTLPVLRNPTLSDIIFNSISGIIGSSCFIIIQKFIDKFNMIKLLKK